MTTITKTKEAPKLGTYQPTSIDRAKNDADFKLLQVGPFVIEWKDGKRETVTRRKLEKLQSSLTWATDF